MDSSNDSRQWGVAVLLAWVALVATTWTWAGGAASNWPELAHLRLPGTLAVGLGAGALGACVVMWGRGWRRSCGALLIALALYCSGGVVTLTLIAGSGHLVLTVGVSVVAAGLVWAGVVALRPVRSSRSPRRT